MGLFKARIKRYVDADGKRVRKGDAGAQAVRERSRKWYGDYKDSKGITRRAPLSADKMAAQAMLNELIRKAERRAAGLFDPFEEQGKRSLTAHLADYETFCRAKGNSEEHVRITLGRIRRLVAGCEFTFLADIEATKVAAWLAGQRTAGKRISAQTSNFYLDGVKYFCNWLVTHERLPRNPLASLKRVSIETDRRHDRRSINDEEFRRLITAAEQGPPVQGLSGADRGMLYLVAAWTGYRRRELASLTLRSLVFDGKTPVVKVRAAYSKRRREDEVPLHPFLVDRLKKWLATAPKRGVDDPLFQLQTPKGHFRKTSTMMRKDLAVARQQWIAEAETEQQRAERESSGFLKYVDEDGLFADFHANRHTFISNLSRAGVALAVAQKLARHSDPRLTANRYTHVDLGDQAAAISKLRPMQESPASARPPVSAKTPTTLPGKSLVAVPVAGTNGRSSPGMAIAGDGCVSARTGDRHRNLLREKSFSNECRRKALRGKARPAGLEPATPGSEDQCSIH